MVGSTSAVVLPGVPSPKEVQLSKQLMQLGKEKDALEAKLQARVSQLEFELHRFAPGAVKS